MMNSVMQPYLGIVLLLSLTANQIVLKPNSNRADFSESQDFQEVPVDSLVIDVYNSCRPYTNYQLNLDRAKASLVEYEFKWEREDTAFTNLRICRHTWVLVDEGFADSLLVRIKTTMIDSDYYKREHKNKSDYITEFPRLAVTVYYEGGLVRDLDLNIKTENMSRVFTKDFISLWKDLLDLDSRIKERGAYDLSCAP